MEKTRDELISKMKMIVSRESVHNSRETPLEDLLKEVDAIIMPTTPNGAFKIGEVEDILTLYLADLFTCPANMAGIPALTIPFGKDKNNMPLGLQICGNYFDENLLYKTASLIRGE
jgi:aspartyl-tRNA(Asn)/glutamyl-tRNA(Gln) amidotransferase subunit A